jgi:hypothetical protein
MKFIKLLPASFLAIPLILQLNAQIDCCGLAVGTVIKSPTVQKFVPRNQNFGSRTSTFVSPPSKPLLCRTVKASSFSPQVNRQDFSAKTQVFNPGKISSSSFVPNARKRYCGGRVSRPGFSTPSSSVQAAPSPLVVYYMERPIKSIRVSSVPDIQRWESGLRENMALNGRNKGKVNELLGRIRNHYGDQSIEAKDYSPNGKGYAPSKSTRDLAESRIERTVKSMADFYEKSGNPEMDPSKSAGGDGFLKGKLSFVNTELDKLGKPRVSLEELKRVISSQMTGAVRPVDPVDPFGAPDKLVQEAPFEEPVWDENTVKERVKEHYLAFAGWLVQKEKKFPSLDPEVDEKTMKTFDFVNDELRKIGKFESLTIFREKTIAYLEDIEDGQIGKPFVPLAEKNAPLESQEIHNNAEQGLPSPFVGKRSGNPFPKRTTVSSHLPLYTGRVLPGKAWDSVSPVTRSNSSNADARTGTNRSFMTPSDASLPGKSWDFSGTVNQNGQSMRIIRSELNNLPGTPI